MKSIYVQRVFFFLFDWKCLYKTARFKSFDWNVYSVLHTSICLLNTRLYSRLFHLRHGGHISWIRRHAIYEVIFLHDFWIRLHGVDSFDWQIVQESPYFLQNSGGSLNIHKNASQILIFSQMNLKYHLTTDFFSFRLNIVFQYTLTPSKLSVLFADIRQNLLWTIFSPMNDERLEQWIRLHFSSLILFRRGVKNYESFSLRVFVWFIFSVF